MVLKFRNNAQRAQALVECKAVALVEKFPSAQQLLFVLPLGEWICLGFRYELGRSLLHWADRAGEIQLNALQKRKIAEKAAAALELLHRTFHRSHGDLSPSNILLQEQEDGDWAVTFIDWEFSRSLADIRSEVHRSFSGTPGFQVEDARLSLVEKDWCALRESLRHVGILLEEDPERPFFQRWKQWKQKK